MVQESCSLNPISRQHSALVPTARPGTNSPTHVSALRIVIVPGELCAEGNPTAAGAHVKLLLRVGLIHLVRMDSAALQSVLARSAAHLTAAEVPAQGGATFS